MKRCYAGFKSQTAALSGKRVLDANAIASVVVKKDAAKSKKGCSYALEIPCVHARNCAGLFERHGVEYLGISEE